MSLPILLCRLTDRKCTLYKYLKVKYRIGAQSVAKITDCYPLQKREEIILNQQINNLWKDKDDKIESAKQALLKHYTDEQNGQITRLLGFAVGLFTLLQLAQSLGDKAFNQIFICFPSLIQFTQPWEGDVLKTLFLFLGTWVILYFILRSIFRFAVFGLFTSYVMWVTIVEARETVRSHVLKNHKKPATYEHRELWVVNQATSKFVYDRSVYHSVKAKWFFSTGYPNCPDRKNTGYFFSLSVAFVIAFLLLLFLW
jgi:hypothetical protein